MILQKNNPMEDAYNSLQSEACDVELILGEIYNGDQDKEHWANVLIYDYQIKEDVAWQAVYQFFISMS